MHIGVELGASLGGIRGGGVPSRVLTPAALLLDPTGVVDSLLDVSTACCRGLQARGVRPRGEVGVGLELKQGAVSARRSSSLLPLPMRLPLPITQGGLNDTPFTFLGITSRLVRGDSRKSVSLRNIRWSLRSSFNKCEFSSTIVRAIFRMSRGDIMSHIMQDSSALLRLLVDGNGDLGDGKILPSLPSLSRKCSCASIWAKPLCNMFTPGTVLRSEPQGPCMGVLRNSLRMLQL